MSETTAETQATEQAGTQTIHANHNPLIDEKEFSFGFRKTKDEETGIESKREAVKIKVGIPSIEGIVAIIQGEKAGVDLLRTAVEDTIVNYLRSVVNDDPKITTENFEYSSIADIWNVIANQPESERKGRGIPAEDWKEFGEDFLKFMPEATGKTVDQIKKQVTMMLQKFAPIRMHEKKDFFLSNFIGSLGIFANNFPGAEKHTAVIDYLVKKADQFLKEDKSADLEKNLGF